MRKRWLEVEIGDAFKTSAGGTPLRSKKQYFDGGTIPWLMSGEVAQREIFSCENFITPLGLQNCSARLLPIDSVLIAMYGATAGQVGILKFEACTNQAVCAIHPNDRFLPPFVYYALLAQQQQLIDSAVGNAQPNLSQIKLRKVRVPVPPLVEQQRIVGILDEAFEGIATAKANAEKNLQNARALFESHLQSVFTQRGEGWVEKRVDDLATKSLGKMLDKAKNRGDLQPYLRNLNVRWFEFDLSDLSEMPFEQSETDKYTTQPRDVMICEGGYPGRAAVWEEEFPIYFQKAIHRVRFHQPELSHWFVYYLYHCDSTGTLRQHFTGSGIQHFTGQTLARFTVPVPPLPAIKKLVARFHSVREETQRLATIYERKLAALDDLKKSLLHQAFSGNL